ncbi:CLUMA_CG002093, isoform A [Clunio marinus]|uniref:CLUMA_CG002093, isoform A n=1 Tax=Clunio marinus TaxID=568069 RepID=A0A1J1HL97_9DIPT|nr:CLUMA_CG002093, isoform A [Clunio marinus]
MHRVLFIILFSYGLYDAFGVPIFKEESLSSITISEIDLPTEATLDSEKADLFETEKPESFIELYEKYDSLFNKNSTEHQTQGFETSPQKRSSLSLELSDKKFFADEKTEEIMEKIKTIVDPAVRKEFEIDILNKGQDLEKDKKKVESVDYGTVYEPDYANKMVVAVDNKLSEEDEAMKNSVKELDVDNDARKMTTHEKEVLQVHLVEQLVHSDTSDSEFTTIIPEDRFEHHEKIENPEIVEVLEHIVYQTNDQKDIQEETTSSTLNVHVDFDPIEIIPKDRHHLRKVEDEMITEKNDKFVGFKTTEDLVDPGQETTEPDEFFKPEKSEEEIAEKTIVETLELVAIFGKSINFDNSSKTEQEEKEEEETTDKVTTEMNEIFSEDETTERYSVATEIVEVNTELSFSSHIESATKKPEYIFSEKPRVSFTPTTVISTTESSVSDKSSKSSSSSSNKSSEESESKESKEKTDEKSSESSEENSAREVFDDDTLKIFDLEPLDTQRSLIDEMLKDTLSHEIKKKDHVEGYPPENEIKIQKSSENSSVTQNLSPSNDDNFRSLDSEDSSVETKTEAVTRLEHQSLPREEIERKFKDENSEQRSEVSDEDSSIEATTIKIYETFEEVITTISDGIQLSNELKSSIISFRAPNEENQTILDTNSEVISSKNIKNPLVDITEKMSRQNSIERSEISVLIIALIGFLSAVILLALYSLMRKRTAAINTF